MTYSDLGLSGKLASKVMVATLLTCLFASLLVLQDAYAEGSWIWVRNTVTGAYGEAIVGTGDTLYIARKNSFYRYTPSLNSFVELAAPPNPDSGDAFKTGTALAWDFNCCIYALYGAATGDSRRWFYRYNISSNSWQPLANTTVDQGEGDAITWVGGGYNRVYATIGGEQRPTHFMYYDPSTNAWSDEPADPPEGMGDGAALVWTGGDYIYALRGEDYEDEPLYDFWRYSISQNTWVSMADIPAYAHSGGSGGVGDGGSLLYLGFWLTNQTDYIYALSGNQAQPDNIPDNRTYRYKISTDSWERLADLPFGIGYYVGNRLGYADGHIYAWQGTPSTWQGGGDDLAKYSFPPEPSPIEKAVNYLISHFNSTVGLIYESEDPGNKIFDDTTYFYNQTYWIYNDNLIATWALRPFNATVSEIINATIQSYNLPPSQMIEVLFGYPIPKNISDKVELVVEQHPDRVIVAEFHNSSTPLLWRNYTDTLIYQSLNEYLKGNRTGALHYFEDAYNMWDGKGAYDLATKEDAKYANYKLALILYAYKVFNLSLAEYPNITHIEDKLWSMQNPVIGGITSLADLNGNPNGSANAETTSMALLPYNDELIFRMRSLFGSYKHDVAIISVEPSPKEVYVGQIVNINVTVENQGKFVETFNVTVYASHTTLEFIIPIQEQEVTDLPPKSQVNLTFTWNTTGATLGNYTISAQASTVQEEANVTNNIIINDIVQVIPELPLNIILPLFLLTTLIAAVICHFKISLFRSSTEKH